MVHHFGVPGRAVEVCELLEHDLDLLAIGSALGDELETLDSLCYP